MSSLPKLQVDPLTHTLTAVGNKSYVLLINGIESSSSQLLAIRPENVISVDVYSIPPAQYSEYDLVVDVKVRRVEGWATGGNIQQSFFPSLGFTNASLCGTFLRGNHTLYANFDFVNRSMKKKVENTRYAYKIGNTEYEKTFDEKGSYIGTSYIPSIHYIYNDGKRHTVQLNITSNVSKGKSDTHGSVISKLSPEAMRNATSTYYPLNVYLDGLWNYEIDENKRLRTNVVLTHISSGQTYQYSEFATNGSTIVSDSVVQDIKKNSITAETTFYHTIAKGYYDVGYKFYGAKVASDIYNVLGATHDNSSIYTHQLYGQYSYRNNGWGSAFTARIDWLNNHLYKVKQSLFKPTVAASVYRLFNDSNQLTFYGYYTYVEPSLGLRSDNQRMLLDNIYYRGNPKLKPYSVFYSSLSYEHVNEWLYFELKPNFSYYIRPIVTLYNYADGGDKIFQEPVNALNTKYYSFEYVFQVKPFSSLLVLSAYGDLSWKNLQLSKNEYVRFFEHPINYSITLNLNKFKIYYQGNLFLEQISGINISTTENRSTIGVQYNTNRFSVFAQSLFFLTQPKYNSRTVSNSIVQTESRMTYLDQRSLFTVGFSFNFNQGKAPSQKTQTSNIDTETGKFL